MAFGFMEVQLVKAKGLRNKDIFGRMDPYVVIKYKGQELRSSVAHGEGRNPKWDEKLRMRIEYPSGSGDPYKLILKIMDKDRLSSDDFLGQAIIYVKELLAEGVENGASELKPLKYRVVAADRSYCGEIEVGLSFTTQVQAEIGEWKESKY